MKTHKVYIKCLFCAKKSFGRNLTLWILATLVDFISDESSGKAFCISGCPMTLSCGYFIKKGVSFYFISLLTHYFGINLEGLSVSKDKRRLRERQTSDWWLSGKGHESYAPISHCSAYFQSVPFELFPKVLKNPCVYIGLCYEQRKYYSYISKVHMARSILQASCPDKRAPLQIGYGFYYHQDQCQIIQTWTKEMSGCVKTSGDVLLRSHTHSIVLVLSLVHKRQPPPPAKYIS